MTEMAHPRKVLFEVVAALRPERPVMNLRAGTELAQFAWLPDVGEAKCADGEQVDDACRRLRVSVQ